MGYLQTLLETPKGWAMLAAMLFLLLMSNACHEGGHALAAWWGGDRRHGLRRRVTLNPVVHFHWLLTLVLPILALILSKGTMIFGGARPVLIDRSKLGRFKMALAALAGPAGNFLFAGFFIVLVSLCMHQEWLGLNRFDWARSTTWQIVQWPLWFSAALGLINLLPFPPLDGGHVVASCLPTRVQGYWYMLAPLGIVALIFGLLWVSGYTWQWGWTGPPPRPNPFILIEGRVKAYIHSMLPFWDSVL